MFGWLYLAHIDKKYSTSMANKLNQIWTKSKAFRYFFYLVGLTVITFITFYLAHYYRAKETSDISNSFYYTFSRSGFVTSLMLIIYPVILGKNKPLLGILGHAVFNALAKITYAVYQIHLIIFAWYLFSLP